MPTPRRMSKRQTDELLEGMARDFASMFARIEQDLLEQMSRDFARGYHSRDASALRHMEIARLRQQTQIYMNNLLRATPEMVEYMMKIASERGALSALRQMSGTQYMFEGAALVQSPAVMALTTELTMVATNAARAILPSLDDFIRRAVAENVPDVLLGMGVQKQAQAKIWQKALRQGITHITDASGKNWNLATYVEMASRTATRRAFTESSVHQMGVHGVQLFTPVIGRDSCKSCAYWAGKILSQGGSAGTWSMQHATEDRTIRVKVDATIDEARSQGWQHPNCRCTLVAYTPGLSVVTDSPEYDPEREGQRVKLRELERKVRKAKVEELAAVTPEQKARAKAKVRDAQAAIRDHVEQADIPRRRDREQLNLGHKDRPPRPKVAPKPGPNQPTPPQKRVVATKSDLNPPKTTTKPKVKTPAPVKPKPKVTTPRVATPRVAPPVRTPAARPVAKATPATKTPGANTSRLPKLDEPMVWSDSRTNYKNANPLYGKGKPGNMDYEVNCTRVAAAMEMRARGFDVRAGAAGLSAHDKSNRHSAAKWVNKQGQRRSLAPVDLSNLDQNVHFKKAPDGARFLITGAWKDGGAHIWNARKRGARLEFFEGQAPVSTTGYRSNLRSGQTAIMRVDDMYPSAELLESGWLEWD